MGHALLGLPWLAHMLPCPALVILNTACLCAGAADVYFRNSATGRCFRSIAAVLRSLDLTAAPMPPAPAAATPSRAQPIAQPVKADHRQNGGEHRGTQPVGGSAAAPPQRSRPRKNPQPVAATAAGERQLPAAADATGASAHARKAAGVKRPRGAPATPSGVRPATRGGVPAQAGGQAWPGHPVPALKPGPAPEAEAARSRRARAEGRMDYLTLSRLADLQYAISSGAVPARVRQRCSLCRPTEAMPTRMRAPPCVAPACWHRMSSHISHCDGH